VVRERERLGGTILPTGIAVPHGRIEGFHDLLIGVWIPEKPFSEEGKTVRALFFSLTSKAGTALYLPVAAALAKFSQDEASLTGLQNARSRTEVKGILDNISLKKEVTVEDIMTADPVTCTAETTLAELADLFYQKSLSYIPVVDSENLQIGEVTIKDLLSQGIPDYVRRLENTRFLKTLEPFETLLLEENNIPVKDIMRRLSRSVPPDASIIEAAAIITGKGVRHLPVLEEGRIVGLVSEIDILKKVIRG
jgi:PTS system nitrogen regulatory IIA component